MASYPKGKGKGTGKRAMREKRSSKGEKTVQSSENYELPIESFRENTRTRKGWKFPGRGGGKEMLPVAKEEKSWEMWEKTGSQKIKRHPIASKGNKTRNNQVPLTQR